MPGLPADLVHRARAGEPQAVDEFVRREWAVVWRAAYAVTADSQLAEDAAQETFVRALRSLGQLRRGPVEPWLRRIAVNCAIDQLRRGPREVVGVEHVPDLPSGHPPTDQDADLIAAVLRLPDERRVVVVLHYWFDYTREEISTVLGIPRGTVASRLARALADLHTRVREMSDASRS
jgi:RNA polymerase sigma-70 factor (ECF subfamily)